jgi:hypothetical protein
MENKQHNPQLNKRERKIIQKNIPLGNEAQQAAVPLSLRKTLGMPNLIRGRKRVTLGNLKGCCGECGPKIMSPEVEGQSTLS